MDLPAVLAVNATSVFWTERSRVRSCPLPAGCALEPALIAEPYGKLHELAVTGDAVYFTGCREGIFSQCDEREQLLRCAASGCPDFVPAIESTDLTFEDIIIGETHVYWRTSGERLSGCALADCAGTLMRWPFSLFGGELTAATTDGETVYVKAAPPDDLRTCGEADGCGAPNVQPDSGSIRAPFRVHAGRAYWFSVNPRPEVRSCELADCGAGTTLAKDNGSTELEVDETGVYWLNATAGTVHHCALAGCSRPRGTVLARGRAGPKALTLGDGFVYWIEGNTIVKIAKPNT